MWSSIYRDIRLFLSQLLSFDKNGEYHENFQQPTSRVRSWPGKRSGKGVALIMRTRPQENLSPTQGTCLYYSRGRRNARPVALIIRARQQQRWETYFFWQFRHVLIATISGWFFQQRTFVITLSLSFYSNHNAKSTSKLVQFTLIVEFRSVHTADRIILLRTRFWTHTSGRSVLVHNTHTSFSAENPLARIFGVKKKVLV